MSTLAISWTSSSELHIQSESCPFICLGGIFLPVKDLKSADRLQMGPNSGPVCRKQNSNAPQQAIQALDVALKHSSLMSAHTLTIGGGRAIFRIDDSPKTPLGSGAEVQPSCLKHCQLWSSCANSFPG